MLHEDLLLASPVGKCVTAHEALSGSLSLDGQLAAAFFSLFTRAVSSVM